MMIKNIQELVAIPSVTGAPAEENMPYGKAVYEALEYVLNLCESFGFRTKNCDNQMGYAEIGEGEEMIGILCHLDVVPTGNGWIHPAFGGEVHDGQIFGRGVIDDKGPAILAIYAMKELMDSGVPLQKRIRILFGCQEESGDWKDMEYYKSTEEIPTYGFTPDAEFPVIYGEKGILNLQLSMDCEKAGFLSVEGGNAPNMVADLAKCSLMTKKGLEMHLELKGVSAHGSMPWDGENAVTKMMEKIAEANEGGLTTCRFADFYMDKIGYALHGEQMNAAFEDSQSGKISYSVGMMGINTETNCVDMIVDARYPVTCDKDSIIARITEEVAEYEVTVKETKHTGPIYMDREGSVIQTLVSAYKEVTGDDTEPMVIGGGTYARLMDNIVAFGPMFPGRECTEHQPNESIFIEDLEKAKEIYKLALGKLLQR